MSFDSLNFFSSFSKKTGDDIVNEYDEINDISLGKLNNEQTDELIKKIVSWYKIKFSGSSFSDTIDSNSSNEMDFDNNFYTMTFDKLTDRLSCEELNSFRCNYINVSDNTDFSNLKNEIGLNDSFIIVGIFTKKNNFILKQYDKICFLIADKKTGNIRYIRGDCLLPMEVADDYTNYTLRQLLNIMDKEANEEIDISILRECVEKHDKDILMREVVINRICDRLLFDDNEDFDVGYYTSMFFLDEINVFYGLDFTYDFLDEVINKHYKRMKVSEKNANKKRNKIRTFT